MSNKLTRVWKFFRAHGFKETVSTTLRYFVIHRRFLLPRDRKYEIYFDTVRPGEEILEEQRKTDFKYKPLLSILVPLYETDFIFLDELIKSIQAQTYSNWQICFSDGSRDKSRLRDKVAWYQKDDDRILYIGEGEDTLGISSNTNQAYTLATGDYIVLGDHDDLFMPDAFYEVVKAINEDRSIDVIYTDEDKTDEGGIRHFEPSMKPAFNPDLLQSCNYITHMFVAKKSLVEKAGLFDDIYNGAQDYDFILRCTELAEKIHHIPKILYSWRVNATSTAGNVEAKLYAYDAGVKAVQAHYDRIGIKATVSQDERLYGHYITSYPLPEGESLTVLVITDGFDDNLKKCIESFNSVSDFKEMSFIPVNPGNRGDTPMGEILDAQINRLSSEYFMIVNCDVRLYSPHGVRDMISLLSARPDVGIAATQFAMPFYRTRHAAIIYGHDKIYGHEYLMHEDYDEEYNQYIDCMALREGCVMSRKKAYKAAGGFSKEMRTMGPIIEDYCMKLREAGLKSVYAGRSICKFRGKAILPDNYKEMEKKDKKVLADRWKAYIPDGDVYYSERLKKETEE